MTPTGGRRRAIASVVLVALATVPLLASALQVGADWVPHGDNAILALRGEDVFSEHTPRLGMPSTLSGAAGEVVHHPGPMEAQAIGIVAAVLDDPRSPLVAITIVNLASVLAVLALARRLGGLALLAVAAPVLAAVLWSLRGPILVTPFNPYAAVLPYLALLVSLVAAVAGVRWAVIPAIIFGSWAAQAHLTASGPVLAAWGVASVVTAVRWFRERRRGRSDGPDRNRLAAALAVVAVCWALPLHEMLENGGGNVRALLRASGSVGGGVLGIGRAVDIAVNALAPRPVWTRAGTEAIDLLATPSPAAYLGAGALVAIASAVAVRHRRERPAIAVGVALAIACIAIGTALTARIPSTFANQYALHNYLWLWPTSALLWTCAAIGVARSVAARLPAARSSARRAIVAGALAFSLVATGAYAVASLDEPHRDVAAPPAYLDALLPPVLESLDPDQPYLVEISGFFEAFDVGTGLLYAMERAGFDVRGPASHEGALGSHRVGSPQGRTTLQVVATEEEPAPRDDAVVVARYEPPEELVARREEAEDELVRAIERRGGLDLLDGQRITVEEAREWVESGGFVAQTSFRNVDPALSRSAAGRTLMRMRSEPTLVVTVYAHR